MHKRTLARWAAGLVVAAGFGVAAVLGVSAAAADDDATPSDPGSVEGTTAQDPEASTDSYEWD